MRFFNAGGSLFFPATCSVFFSFQRPFWRSGRLINSFPVVWPFDVNSREKTNRFRSQVTRSPVTNITSSDSRLQRVFLQPSSLLFFHEIGILTVSARVELTSADHSSNLETIPRVFIGNFRICFRNDTTRRQSAQSRFRLDGADVHVTSEYAECSLRFHRACGELNQRRT